MSVPDRGSFPPPLLAVDVGNTRIKFAFFAAPSAAVGTLPSPTATWAFDPRDEWSEPAAVLAGWNLAGTAVRIASVNAPLRDELLRRRPWEPAGTGQSGPTDVALVKWYRLPLPIALPEPGGIGIDRLCAAWGADALRSPGEPLLVVDCGTAITCNLLSAEGVFLGGAILPGLRTAVRALRLLTDKLPEIELPASAPPALGTGTVGAIGAGVFWGAIGTIREFARQFELVAGRPPRVLLTGGDASRLAPTLAGEAELEPHLTLRGIARAYAAEVAASPASRPGG